MCDNAADRDAAPRWRRRQHLRRYYTAPRGRPNEGNRALQCCRGRVAAAPGIGASTPGLAEGLIVDHFGLSAVFLIYNAAACGALAVLFLLMPATAPGHNDGVDSGVSPPATSAGSPCADRSQRPAGQRTRRSAVWMLRPRCLAATYRLLRCSRAMESARINCHGADDSCRRRSARRRARVSHTQPRHGPFAQKWRSAPRDGKPSLRMPRFSERRQPAAGQFPLHADRCCKERM